jgi:hypothetical protein
MPRRVLNRLLILASTLAGAGALAAWDTPAPAPVRDCTFAIQGRNDSKADVWVMLYDSRVFLNDKSMLTDSYKQLKIQNHRIAPGATMDRRYTSYGRCETSRTWFIRVKPAGVVKTIRKETSGDYSDSRTVDLGPVSEWVYAQ